MLSRYLRRGAAVAAPLLFCCHGALGASLDVSPVRIDLAATARSTELRLRNTGTEEVSVQIDVREWVQDLDGADELVATQQLLAVPPLVTIPPGERQIVRIGHLGAPAQDVEQSYRVLVTELAPSTGVSKQPALSMRLRLSIPLFVAPAAGTTAPDIVVDDFVDTAEGARFALHNAGNAHAKIEQIEVRRDGEWAGVPAETSHRVRYLLPGGRAQLAIPDRLASLSAVRIKSADGREWEHAVRPPQ
jgi:fimbrial chaperone protein